MQQDSFIATTMQNPLKSSLIPVENVFDSLSQKGLIMPAQQNDDLPAIGVIYETWLTTAQVAEMHDMDMSSVAYLCRKKILRSVKFGGEQRGEWRIDPIAARQYIRRKPAV